MLSADILSWHKAVCWHCQQNIGISLYSGGYMKCSNTSKYETKKNPFSIDFTSDDPTDNKGLFEDSENRGQKRKNEDSGDENNGANGNGNLNG